MIDNISYETKESFITIDKMQFTITNHYPQYSLKDKETVKAEIENQLYAVFYKYGCT